jgi:hypothetical protein
VGMVVDSVGEVKVHALAFDDVMKTLRSAGLTANPNPNLTLTVR